ncbi:MAG: hydrogenase maturation protease [Thermodesulfobacteriota bacterium]
MGNRFCRADSLGPLVYDYLAMEALPQGVELVDGGLAGLNLLSLFEGCRRIVVVDRVDGFGRPGEVLKLGWDDYAQGSYVEYGHSSALHYLLLCLPSLGIVPATEVLLVGAEDSGQPSVIAKAAEIVLEAVNE